jgi:hypothetical protein
MAKINDRSDNVTASRNSLVNSRFSFPWAGTNRSPGSATNLQKCAALAFTALCFGTSAWGCVRLSGGRGSSSRDPVNSASALANQDTKNPAQRDTVDRVAAIIDNPQKIYESASYKKLWTADSASVTARLPKGLKTVPHEARVWEDWFRKHLTDGEKRFSTSDLLMIKKTVMETVANDPKCQFQAPQTTSEVAKNVENARISGLKSLGVNHPSSALTQMTRIDAVTAYVKGQWDYARDSDRSACPRLHEIEEDKAHPRYPTGNELLGGDYRFNCARSNILAIYVLREMEKASPTGLKVGSVYIFTYRNDGKMGLHSNIVGRIALPGNQFAHLYYDPTASGKGSMHNVDLNSLSRAGGPLDEASVERYVNGHCLAILKEDPKENVARIQFVTYTYPLGENWPQFGLGNFDGPKNCHGTNWDSMQPGKVAFEEYIKTNLSSINSLDRAVDDAYSGRL